MRRDHCEHCCVANALLNNLRKITTGLDLSAVHPGGDRLRRLQMRYQVPEDGGLCFDVLLGMAQEYGYGNFRAALVSEQKPTDLDDDCPLERSDRLLREGTDKVDCSQIFMKGPGAFAELHRQKAMTACLALLGNAGHEGRP